MMGISDINQTIHRLLYTYFLVVITSCAFSQKDTLLNGQKYSVYFTYVTHQDSFLEIGNLRHKLKIGESRSFYSAGSLQCIAYWKQKRKFRKVVLNKWVDHSPVQRYRYRFWCYPVDSLVEYYPNGNLKNKLFFTKKGKIINWKKYLDNGNISEENFYTNGEMTSTVSYCDNGDIYATISYNPMREMRGENADVCDKSKPPGMDIIYSEHYAGGIRAKF